MIEYESFTSFDNKIINYIRWKAQEEKAKLICVHGLGSYAASFNKLGKYAKENNITVTAMDLRGFGTWQYENKWAYSNFLHSIKDLDLLIENECKSIDEANDCFLLGDSLGALLILYWFITGDSSNNITGMIFTSPYFANKSIKHIYRLIRIVGLLFSNKKVKLVQSFDKLTKDKSFEEFDKKVGLGARWLTVGVLLNVLDLSLKIEKYLRRNNVDIPILWLHGENDIVTKSDNILRLSKQMQMSKHTIKVFKSGHHFLLNDLISESVYESIIDFILLKDEKKMRSLLLETVQ
jgi:alpha-beta hydrolase superfamily lysophospholipase